MDQLQAKQQHKHSSTEIPGMSEAKNSNSLVKDPVCGMMIDPTTAKGGSIQFKAETYYFCNPKCKDKFQAEPQNYLSNKVEAEKNLHTEVIYTCPMHPEIRQKGPGSCPICGMALEPEEITLDEKENPELLDFTKKLKLCIPLTIPLLFLAMSDIIPGQPLQHKIPLWLNSGIQFLLASPVVLWGGFSFFERGWESLKSRKLNMFTLISLGTGVAYLFSLVGTFLPSLFPESIKLHGGMVPLYYEAAAVITTLVLLGRFLSFVQEVRLVMPFEPFLA